MTDDELEEKWNLFVQEIIFEPNPNATVTLDSLKQKYARELHELYENPSNNRYVPAFRESIRDID